MSSSATPQPGEPSSTSERVLPSKPKIFGIYGVSGCGKSHLMRTIEGHALISGLHEKYEFFEGSNVIAEMVPGGLSAFKDLGEGEKKHFRQKAIERIAETCHANGHRGVVAGHFMFWEEGEAAGTPVYTHNDLDTFTHILYLNVPPDEIFRQRQNDTTRQRPLASAEHLDKWQQTEMTQLRELCNQHHILFSTLKPYDMLGHDVLMLFGKLYDHFGNSESDNTTIAKKCLDDALGNDKDKLETALIMDGDRTLAAQDTGEMFWTKLGNGMDPLRQIFGSQLRYSYTAFVQATLLYEEVTDANKYEEICQRVASEVNMHPEFVALLKKVAAVEHVGAFIVTCGLRRIWEIVVEKEGLSDAVKVIGGGRIANGYVVTAAVKAALVGRLQKIHYLYVWVFGDSWLDLAMMEHADQAIVVVGEENSRSKSMEEHLRAAIDTKGLKARQLLLPSHATPRLDTDTLPLVDLSDDFLNSILCRRPRQTMFNIDHATDRDSAKLLMTPTRDAKVTGPALREAHRRVGWYLATEFLSELIGVEGYSIPHVQGHPTDGYRLRDEGQTLIIALMRGGEPMALGVSEVLPSATFLHAKEPADVQQAHLAEQQTVLLVDSVVNNGTTLIKFSRHIRELHPSVRIVVVTIVAQAQSVAEGGPLAQAFARDPAFALVALRLSENKFTGKGPTDTGGRLFNTTRLE